MKELRCCQFCREPFWVNKSSEKENCSLKCANDSRSLKVKAVSATFDTEKARLARTEESFKQQAKTLTNTLANQRRKQKEGWFGRLGQSHQESIRSRLREVASTRGINRPTKTGSIHRYGLLFDSKVEVFIYEQLMLRNIFAVRPAPFNGWLVDFGIPDLNRYIEIKSWWTVNKLQGVESVVSRMHDKVLLVEEKDAYKVHGVSDFWGYMEEKSHKFKADVLRMSSHTAEEVGIKT